MTAGPPGETGGSKPSQKWMYFSTLTTEQPYELETGGLSPMAVTGSTTICLREDPPHQSPAGQGPVLFQELTCPPSNISMSLAAAWTSPTLAGMLADPNSGVGHREASIVDGLLPAGAIASGLLARLVLDRIGRKQANLLGGLFFLTSWILLALTRGIVYIYLARFIAGLAVGTLYLSSGIYVAEVASQEVRQMLFAVSQVFTNLGFLLEYCLGPYVSYTTLVLVSGAPSVIYLSCVPFVVESPYYLVSKGYYEEAKEVLRTLRGREDVAAEFKSIQEGVAESGRRTLRELTRGPNRRALTLATGAMLAKQLTGGIAIVSYAGPLLAEAGLPVGLASFLLGSAKLLTSVITILLVLRFGVKRLVVVSLVGITASLTILLVYFILKNKMDLTLEGVIWIPLAALILYFVFSDFGIGPFPSYIGAELFSQKAKGMGTAIALTTGHVFSLFTIFLFTSTDFVVSLGVFTVCTALAVPLIAIFLVDTSGKSLAEIQKNPYKGPKHDLEQHL